MATYIARFMSTLSNSDEPNQSSDFRRPEFKIVCPMNIPSSLGAAAIRTRKNLSHFALHYTHFIWIILFITLIPRRKVSLILLVIMTYVASLYLLLVQALPKTNITAKILDKRLVLSVIVLATVIQLIATHAGLHLVFTLVGTLPVILVHVVFWVKEEMGSASTGGVFGEFLPLVNDDESMVNMA
ncbi:hypothetical protein M5689_022195 [Euphorbia peplus]|nr:hypothetical protein M5689_022195 [Euphorbia peplus]